MLGETVLLREDNVDELLHSDLLLQHVPDDLDGDILVALVDSQQRPDLDVLIVFLVSPELAFFPFRGNVSHLEETGNLDQDDLDIAVHISDLGGVGDCLEVTVESLEGRNQGLETAGRLVYQVQVADDHLSVDQSVGQVE